MVMKDSNYEVKGQRVMTWKSGPTPLPPPQTTYNVPFLSRIVYGVASQNGVKPYKYPNPHSYNVMNIADWRGERVTSYPVSGMPVHRYESIGTFGSNSAKGYTPPWESTSLFNAALEKLNSKTRGSLDLSISLAEAGQTLRMVKSTTKFLDFAKFAGLGGVVAGTRALANGWLQFQYGWRPLLSDVFAAADEGIRISINKIEHFHARQKRIMDGTLEPMQVVDGVLIPTHVVMTGVQSCQFNIRLTIPDESFDPTRWTSMNPISIGWELIPYSFVVDWFVDVGSYLRNVETALLYNTRWHSGSVTELYQIETEETVNGFFFTSGGMTERWNKFSAFSKKVFFRRSVLTSYPLPHAPTFKVDLGSSRMITAAALLRQMLKK